MEIVMVIYSQTGNTLSVAQKLERRLTDAGHSVTVEHLKTEGEARPGDQDVELKTFPDPTSYDAIVFGAPVHAFSLAPAMQAYLRRVSGLEGKPVACLVTQFFPFAWMGGRRAARQLRAATESKGARVCATAVVNWSFRRESRIDQVVDKLSKCFAK